MCDIWKVPIKYWVRDELMNRFESYETNGVFRVIPRKGDEIVIDSNDDLFNNYLRLTVDYIVYNQSNNDRSEFEIHCIETVARFK